MRSLWQMEEATSAQLVAEVSQHRDWNAKTIQTLLRRLVEKGVVDVDRNHRVHLYRAQLGQSECQREARRNFLDRVFGGKVAPLLAGFLADEELSEGEIEELRELLDQKKGRK